MARSGSPRQHEHLGEAPIQEIGVQCHDPLERRDCRVVLAPATEDVCEYGLRLGQVGVEPDRLAGQLMRPVKGGRIEMVGIVLVDPGR
jgi:hypothetical protein